MHEKIMRRLATAQDTSDNAPSCSSSGWNKYLHKEQRLDGDGYDKGVVTIAKISPFTPHHTPRFSEHFRARRNH